MKTYSIAIYGSSLRPSFDKYSDKDLLVVSSSFTILIQLKNFYEDQGFSVSTYTYSKLKFLSIKGSLFIEHLKRESSIVFDYDNQLKLILDQHIEVIPTESEINECRNYFQFLKHIPDSEIGYAWFCDCFYVGLRNYLILQSAKQKQYNFSFISLIEELKTKKIVTENEFNLLKELRIVKKNYRDKIVNEFPDSKFIEKITEVGEKLGLLSDVKSLPFNSFKIEALKDLNNATKDSYHKLRLLEICYLNSGLSIARIDKIISNPQFYASKFRNDTFVTELLNEIREQNHCEHKDPSKMAFVQ